MECVLDDVTVHYVEYGEGFPVVMLHGFSPDHRLMTGCMEPVFADRPGWRRIYLDLPGMGRTKGADWITGSDDMLAVVERVVERLIPAGAPFLVAGESYGGYLARGLLTRQAHRMAGMLLICAAIHAEKEKRDLPPFTVLARDEKLLAELTPEEREEFASIAVVQDRCNWERFEREILSGVRMADLPFLEKLKQRYAFSFEVEPLVGRYDKPVLIVTGRQDDRTGYRDAWTILEHYPRASFVVLDRAGHNLQIEQSRLFTALVHEWLDRVEEELRRENR
jgi:pimeloyl-ACP methyl ester carboxylesterase